MHKVQYSRRLEEKAHYQLIVCGGGVAGYAAALAAARRGVRAALVEREGCLGGTATNCGVHFFLGGRKYNEKTNLLERKVGGIFDELTDALIAEGAALELENTDFKSYNPFGWYPRMAASVPFEPQRTKAFMERRLMEEGVKLYYFTSILDVAASGDKIDKIVCFNKSGMFSLGAECFVDATGDADVAFFMGCPTRKGRPSDSLMAPASLEMVLDSVDGRELVAYQNKHQSPKFAEIIDQLKEQSLWPFPFDIVVLMQLVEEDVFLVNTMRQIGVDGTDGDSVTAAMVEGRAGNLKLFELLRKYFPGFQKARIRYIADKVGIRESRRITGLYNVSLADALTGKKFGDCIAATTYNFDLPDPLAPSHDPMLGDARHPNDHRAHEEIEIPYQSLVPQGCCNLIAAGRCISVDREVLGPARIMGPCFAMGQAAGLAAYVCLQRHIGYREVDALHVQALLLEENCLLPRRFTKKRGGCQ
jgi:hypothetical protein